MFVPINVPPGVLKVDSPYAASGRWIDMDKVRFVRGRPEKLGGVQKLVEGSYTGTVRGAHAWNTYAGVQCLVFGTACALHLLRDGVINDITPYRIDATGISLTDPFETTNGSAIVTVTDATHGIEAAGTTVTFAGASAVGGVTIDGDYAVTEVVDENTFTVTHTSAASSDATGGGTVTASYEINCGDVDPDYLVGWGVGGWGEGNGWGADVSLSQALISEPMIWSLDAYGEDLVVNILNDGLWMYDGSAGVQRPTRIANSPAQSRWVFVTPERYIMALGCSTLTGTQDNMTVRWADVEDNTDWTPSSTNTANQRKLQGGTRLMAGTAVTDGINLIWSDAAAFLFQFTGSNEVYASRQIASNCGLIAPHAFAKINGGAFWMGSGNFWMYAGYVQPIPNAEDMRAWVFKNLNQTHIFKSFAFYNPLFNEVWFVFPWAGSTEPNYYVMVGLDGFWWGHGTWDRTAAAQYWTGERRPILFGDGQIYAHDVADNQDDDQSAMTAFIELAPTDIQGGNICVDIFGFVPDFQRQSGDIELYVYGLDHPRDGVMMEDTVTVEETDKLVDLRSAGRQFGLKLTSNEIGGDFRLGKFGLEIEGAGMKRGSQT